MDNSNQVVPGATITLVNESTGNSRAAVSGSRGEFAFRAVDAGSYAIKLELTGFRSLELRHNVLNASGTLDLGNLKLEVGTLTEAITVVAEGSTIETKNATTRACSPRTQISQIRSRGRDVVNLLRLLPGVHYENDIEAMGDSFGSQIPNIGGQRKNWNQVTIDGLNGNELSGTNRMNSSINLDAIAEVKVLLNSYKAEFGHTGGANIQIVSKSGTSDYRGSAYWYGKRDAWNASPWENNRAASASRSCTSIRPASISAARSRFPDSTARARRRSCSSSTRSRRRRCSGRARSGCTGCRRRSSGRGTSPRRWTPTGVSSSSRIPPRRSPAARPPAGRAASRETSSRPPGSIRTAPPCSGCCRCPTPRQSPNYNFARQETADNPRFNNVLRMDFRPSGNNTIWGTYRRGAGTGACLAGNDPCAHVVRPVLVGNPSAGGGNPLTGWFNTAAFARPSGLGDYGNAPRNVIRRPGVVNWNLALFKNIAAGGHRSVQFRAEAYNVLNHTEFQDIDRTARFDPSGAQINPNFGTAIGIASPTRPPRTIQLSARFSF